MKPLQELVETSHHEFQPYVLEVQFCLVFVVHKTMIDF